MIPKIIHQIWVKNTPRPDETFLWAKRLQALNPLWEYQLHEAEPMDGVKPQHVANVVRMDILSVIGGVYLDCDMEPFAALDGIGMDLSGDAVYCDTFAGRPHHAFVAAAPNNATIKSIATDFRSLLTARATGGYVQVLHNYVAGLTLLPGIACPVGTTGVAPCLYHHMLSGVAK